MNITDLTNLLLSDKEHEVSDKGFNDAYEQFIAFLSDQGGFAVYFDSAHDCASTAYLTRRLAEKTNTDRSKIGLIYDKACESKIKEHLPYFNEYKGKFEEQSFILNGGSEQNDPFWSNSGKNIKYVMSVRPYLDGADFSFIKIRNDSGDFITYFTDSISMNQFFSMRNYKIDLENAKTNPDKAYWQGIYELQKADTVLESKISLFTISGLEAGNRGDNGVLILALSMLQHMKNSSGTKALVFTDYTSCDESAFKLLRCFCDNTDPAKLLTALKELYPHASESDIKIGLLNPLLQKRSELAELLNKVVFWNGDGFGSDKLYIFPIGAVPYDYYAELYSKSEYIFFESCDLLNLAANVGVPFLHKGIEISSGYPDFFNPSAVVYLSEVCDIFKSDISAYLCAFNKKLNQEIDSVAEFLSNPRKGDYFDKLSKYAQDELNDKLAATGGVFSMLYNEMSKASQKHIAFRNADNNGLSSFESLYEHLRKSCTDCKNFNLSAALSDMRVGGYLESLGGIFIIELESIDSIAYDYHETDDGTKNTNPEDICGVSIRNAKSKTLEGGTFEINFTDWYGGDNFGVYINGNFSQPNCLFNIPWLKFSDVNFSVITAENNMPTKGSVGATFGGNEDYYGANFVIDLNAQNGLTRIMATFREPLTIFGAFGAIAGGIDFNALLPPELNFLKLGLSELVFYYDKNNNAITSMNFAFSSKEEWKLWTRNDGTVLLSAVPSIAVTVNSPADSANRQVMVSVGAFVDIGGKNAVEKYKNGIGQLWLGGSCPPLVAEMRMASEFIDVDKLLELFGCSFKTNMTITDLSVLADFGNKHYKLSAAISTDWKIHDSFVITGLGLHIADKSGKFAIGFAGTMRIFDKLNVGVAVGYNDGVLSLQAKASLNSANDIKMSDLVQTYKGGSTLMTIGNGDDPPALGGIDFSLMKKDDCVDFTVSAYAKNWYISFLDKTISAEGAVGRKFEAEKYNYFAYLKATINLLGAGCVLVLDYNVTTPSFKLQWGIFEGTIDKNSVTLELKQFSVGEMIETLVGWCCGSRFSLDPPWDILNSYKISFNLKYEFDNKKFTVSVITNIKLGFGELSSVDVVYDPKAEQKVQVNLKVKYAWESSTENVTWDATKPGTAPAPNGKGNKYFDLNYLAFGQKVAFFEPGFNPPTTQAAMDELLKRTAPEEFPRFDGNAGMLVAANFKILKCDDKKDKSEYFLDAALIFYDPSLFALRIKLAGTAAKIFAGFGFEIIYAKLSDTLGVFKSTIVLPDRFRKFDIGAFSVTLPDFYIEIYTNGDFLIDIGFPKNGDFSRSFSLSGIIAGIPVTGSLGLYFGKLSSATAESSGKHLPKSSNGQFNPAIVFGIGLRIGIGKSISYGILSGGFSLTLNTILEGVIAKWNPYTPPIKDTGEQWYYYLKGTAALIGNLYGKIDFGIICASVNVTISVAVDFEYETYRPTLLIVSAKVEAEVSLVIDLWLFKIKISFSFKLQVKESFTIGKKEVAPWDGNQLLVRNNNLSLFEYPKSLKAAKMNFDNLTREKDIIKLNANLSLALTAAIDEYASGKKYVVGNVMLTLQKESFNELAITLIYWLLAASGNRRVTQMQLSNETLTDEVLAEIEEYLDCVETPISHNTAEKFLVDFFIIDVPAELEKIDSNNPVESTYFPLPSSVMLTCGEYSYVLKDYNKLNLNAPKIFKEIFKKYMLVVENEVLLNKKFSTINSEMSLAEWVFGDWFNIAATYAVRSMREILRTSATSITIGDIITKVNLNQLSGILSRFFLHGLRLPTKYNSEELITPKKQGMWVNDKYALPQEAGLFALTGQAFIVPVNATKETFRVGVSVNENSYFKVPSDYHIFTGVNDEFAQLVKKISNESKDFKIIHTFDEFSTGYAPEIISFGKHIEINDKYFWTVPESLAQYFNRECLAYPKFRLDFTNHTENIQTAGTAFAPVALVEFDLEVTETEKVYIICGANKSSVDILRKMITSDVEYKSIGLLVGIGESTFHISQINMSTETRPPENLSNSSTLNDSKKCKETLTLLWKALVTNNRGYILTYHDSAGTELSEKVTLAVTFEGFTIENSGEYLPLINAVSSDKKPDDNLVLTAFAEAYTMYIKPIYSAAQIAESCYTDIRRIAENNNIGFCALWENRDTSNYFKKDVCVTVQPGFRIPSGCENTTSLMNMNYIIRRKKSDSTLNFPLLCYGRKDSLETSAPHSHREDSDYWVYDITMPICEGYGKYGKEIETRFDWVDYYGNKLALQFHGGDNKAGYQDQLLGLSKWLFISTSWKFTNKTTVTVVFDFLCDNDEFNLTEANNFYKRLLTQLEDERLCASLKCSFFEDTSKVNKSKLIEQIDEIIGSPTEKKTFTLDFAFNKAIEIELFPLECSFIMERSGCFAESGYEEVADIIRIDSHISVLDLRKFAKSFNSIFDDSYKVLKSAGESEIYAYKVIKPIISVAKEQTPQIFLPRPVSNKLHDYDNIEVQSYKDGKFTTVRKNYRAVDLNIWLRNALRFAGSIMSPDIVSAVAITDCDYGAVLNAKKTIAEKLSKMLAYAYSDDAHKVPDEAAELFYQRLLGSLSSYYGVKSVIVLPVTVQGVPNQAKLYGSLTNLNDVPLSYSSPKLSNGKTNLVFAVSGTDVVLDSSGAVMPSADLKLSYNVTHIEDGITEVVDGFNTSDWYSKLDNDIVELPIDEFEIPLPLYNFPETPVMLLQEAKTYGNEWAYEFTYSRSHSYPQQVCHCRVRYNIQACFKNSSTNSLFNALAQIDESGSAVYYDLCSAAANIDVNKENFINSFKCALELLSSLAKTNFDSVSLANSDGFNLAEEETTFSVVEKKYKNDIFSMVLPIKITPVLEGCESEYIPNDGIWIFKKNDGAELSAAEGQSMPKRKFILPKKNILKHQNAIVEVYVKQNETLHDDFVFTTPTTAFDVAITPSCVVEDVSLHDYADDLNVALINFLYKQSGDNEVTLQVRCTYSNESIGDIAPVVYPVFSQTKVIVNNFSDVIKGWLDVLGNWRVNFDEKVYSEGVLSFDFIFFSKFNDVPLLTVKNAFFRLRS